MPLDRKLRIEVERDIEVCKNHTMIKGSEALYGKLVAKYTVVDGTFSKNLSTSGKTASMGAEFDFRPELEAISMKLEMWLLMDNMGDVAKKKCDIMPIEKTTPTVFISHRSIDKEVADMLLDFLVGVGIPGNFIFCSSLPGNDIREKISQEVRTALRASVVNIVMLSSEYYQSAYCLNEAGIIWFCEKIPAVPIALPEITTDLMYGFLNNDYKIRRLDNDDDVSYIYDVVQEATSSPQAKTSIVTAQISKLKGRYKTFLESRAVSISKGEIGGLSNITTDDEAIVLYYILQNNVRKVKKSVISEWTIFEELYDVNIDNAFDLLSSFGTGNNTDNVLELDIDTFRQLSGQCDLVLIKLLPYVEKHRRLSEETFKELWHSGSFGDLEKLFTAYIIEERISAFGDRWMSEAQIASIKAWEVKNDLVMACPLSENYNSCLKLFIDNHLVYVSSLTSNGNPREYTLCTSIRKYLQGCDFSYSSEIEDIKQMNTAFR